MLILQQTAGLSRSVCGGKEESRMMDNEVFTLKIGKPKLAAFGLDVLMCVSSGEARQVFHDRMNKQEEGIKEEVESFVENHHDKDEANEVLELLEYILYQGTQEKEYSNGIRDQGREAGLRLEYFTEHENARNAKLLKAEVVALRLYTTKAYKFMNDPLRDDQRRESNKPCLLPVTTRFAEQVCLCLCCG